jgi:hypothetical protein
MSNLAIRCASLATLVLGAPITWAQTCGQQFTFDMSPWFPDGVWGEAISLTTIQGEIINARVDATFVSNEENPWSMFANFELPTGITGVDSQTGGWKGVGTFTTSFETEALNGVLASPDGGPYVTWFLVWGGGTPSKLPDGTLVLSPMDGYFETLKLTITLADCHAGDVNANMNVDVDDLLIVINNWGQCDDGEECIADLTGNGVVDVDDLLIVINNWGNYWCPPPFC